LIYYQFNLGDYMNILDHFGALRAFDAVMRLGSVKAAAVDLCVTDGAVSRKISAIEVALGQQLFYRRHRKLAPTAFAVSVHLDVSAALARLRSIEDKIGAANEATGVTISAPATFLSRWLIPRHAGLQKVLGKTPVLFTTYHGEPGMAPTPAQIFIAVGDTVRSSAASFEPFMSQSLGLVLQRQHYEAICSDPEWPRQITRFTPASFRHVWALWSQSMAGRSPELTGPEIVLDRMHYAIEAAEAGQGCSIVPVEYVSEAIANGKLVLPFGVCDAGEPFQLHIPLRSQTQASVLRTARWLRIEGALHSGDLQKSARV